MVSPSEGAPADSLQINGSGFQSGAVVMVGGQVLLNVVVLSSSVVTGSLPGLGPGTVSITVTNPNGLVSNTVAFTVTVKSTATPSASPSPGPAPQDQGTLRLDELRVLAQPVHGPLLTLALRLEGRAQEVELRAYTRNLVAVAVVHSFGSFGPGWARATFALPPGLPTGVYYLRVILRDGGSSVSGLTKLYLLK